MSELLDAIYKAHDAVTLRGNPSHHALVLAAKGSGNYLNSITAALMTLGGLHGPYMLAYDLLTDTYPEAEMEARLETGLMIPGWGSSFVKEGIEPAFLPVWELLQTENTDLATRIQYLTDYLHVRGKILYPNPACFTAAVAITLGIPREASGYIVIQGRLLAWTREFVRVVSENEKI